MGNYRPDKLSGGGLKALSLSRGPTGGALVPATWPSGPPGSQPMRRRVSFSNTPTLAAVVGTYLNPVNLPLK